MDKFRELQLQIESVIAKIDKQISNKQTEIVEINSEIEDAENLISKLKESLESATKKRETLSKIKDKSIIIYIIKECINDCIKEFNELVENKQWFMIALVIFCFLFAILLSSLILINFRLQSLPLASILFSLYFFGGNLDKILSLHNLKRHNSLEGLEDNIKGIETSLNINKSNVAKYDEKLKQLKGEIQALQNEKAYYEEELKRIIQARESAIEQIALPLLDESYEKVETSEVIGRIRSREKKAGTKNDK